MSNASESDEEVEEEPDILGILDSKLFFRAKFAKTTFSNNLKSQIGFLVIVDGPNSG